MAQQAPSGGAAPASAADAIADFFSSAGDQIFEECIFELSQEQIDVQQELIKAYTGMGASGLVARQLAVKQIQPPKLSEKCEQIRRQPKAAQPDWSTTTIPVPKKPAIAAAPKKAPEPLAPATALAKTALAKKKPLPQWDCASNVDYVTIHHNGFERKLTDGEICNPFEDVVHEVPASLKTFRLGYTIRTGRVFVIADDPQFNGKTITWAISGRDVCRNNPDPDCLAARAVGPLPPGEYSFSDNKAQRVSWGPKTKRNVAGIYLTKLANKERFSPAQAAAIRARGNIAIHVRLKGEMSEACLGLEPKGWAHVATLIKDMRATGVTVLIDEPYPQIAEAPPVIVASSFSFSSLFK
ncbi:MAG: DUF2778 domain-containing protein [Hyphomicrobium sp.]